MKLAIIGASGFIGREVTTLLLKTTKYELVLFSHQASKLHFSAEEEKRITHIDGSVLTPSDIERALQGCQQAVYLVHLMGGQAGRRFGNAEQRAAHNFGKAAAKAGIQRVLYVGGMGQADQQLTDHLNSRLATGTIIRSYVPLLIELRTPMVVGNGGAGFEVLKQLSRLPILPVPSWARAVTQPITVSDVARYVAAAIELKTKQHISVAIGGPEAMTYIELAKRYARQHGKQIRTVPLPFVTQNMAARVLHLFKQPHTSTVADMIGSAGYSVQVGDEAQQLFPKITPEPIKCALR